MDYQFKKANTSQIPEIWTVLNQATYTAVKSGLEEVLEKHLKKYYQKLLNKQQ